MAFLDIVLPRSDSQVFATGSRLQIFTCREHDDIAGTIYSDYTSFEAANRNQVLPSEYWTLNDGHYLLRLLPPSVETREAGREPRLVPQYLVASKTHDDDEGFKLFGEPNWLQDPETHDCSCGAPMQLLLQIPDGMGFASAEGAEKQPNSFSKSKYCIFLGNQLYLFGCSQQCNPLALWPVLQN